MRGLIAAAVVLMGVGMTAAWGQGAGLPTAEEVIKSVPALTGQNEKLKSLVATMKVRMGGKIAYKGRLVYRSPGKNFLVMSSPAGDVPMFIVSANEIICFDPMEQQVSVIRGVELIPAMTLVGQGDEHFNTMTGAAMRLGGKRNEGVEWKPKLELDPGAIVAQSHGKPEVTRAGDRLRIRGALGTKGREIEMEVEPGREFPCRYVVIRDKDQKEPLAELVMEANGEVGDEEFRAPDIEVLRKRVVVKDVDGEKMGPGGAFGYAMNVMANAMAVQMTADTEEDRAEAEKQLKGKIDWEGAKEWDRKIMIAYREAMQNGKTEVHKTTDAPDQKEPPAKTEVTEVPDRKEPLARTQIAVGPKGKVAELIEKLGDADAKTRRQAAKSLVEMGAAAKEAATALIKALGDPDAQVQGLAAVALGRIGREAKEIMPALIKAFEDPDARVREGAAGALRQIGPDAKEAVPALIKALDDPDFHVRMSAAVVLSRIGPEAREAATVLIRVLGDPNAFVRQEVAEALGAIGPEAKEAVPALIKTLGDTDVDVREKVAEALGLIGPDAKEAVPALIKALRDPVFQVRWHAANALGGIGPEAKEAIPELQRLAEKDPEESVRRIAPKVLEKIGK
jgi:hypothetical protein